MSKLAKVNGLTRSDVLLKNSQVLIDVVRDVDEDIFLLKVVSHMVKTGLIYASEQRCETGTRFSIDYERMITRLTEVVNSENYEKYKNGKL